MFRPATARTKACAFRPLARWLPLIPHTFASPYRKTGDRCHAWVCLFDESSPPPCPHSLLARCRFYREGAAEARAAARGNAPPAPCRIAKSRAGGCLRAQQPAGRSSSAPREASGSLCARKTSLCARTDRSRSASSLWPGLPSRLRSFFFPQPPQSKRGNSVSAYDGLARAALAELFLECCADSRSSTASPICDLARQHNESANPWSQPTHDNHRRTNQNDH